MAAIYNRAKFRVLNGTLDLDADDIRVMLLGTATPYTPNVDHDFVADVVASELSGASGYARQQLTGETVTLDDTNDRAYFDADDTAFGALGAGATIAYAVVYRQVTNDADSPLIGYYEITPNVPTNGSTFTVQWNAGGILRAT